MRYKNITEYLLEMDKLFVYNVKSNMRVCWNRQTGTVEGRVSQGRMGSSPITRTRIFILNKTKTLLNNTFERVL